MNINIPIPGFDNVAAWPFIAAFSGAAILLGILLLLFWIWMIIDCAKRKFKNDIEKIVWLVVIVLAHWLGALVYLLIIKLYNPSGLVKHGLKK